MKSKGFEERHEIAWYIRNILLCSAFIACGGCADLNYHPTIDNQHGWYEENHVTNGSPKQWFDHVLIIVMENGNKEDVEQFGFFNRLLNPQDDNIHAGLPDDVNTIYFRNYHGLVHPSYSNYLSMVSGRMIESHFDTQQSVEGINIADRLEEKSLKWRNYAEGYPGNKTQCNTSDKSGNYVRKHVPFLSFDSTKTRCQNIISIDTSVPGKKSSTAERWRDEGDMAARNMQDDWGNEVRPSFAIYTPNLIHDGHDMDGCLCGNKLQQMSSWLEGFITHFQRDKKFWDNTLVVITFDESEASNAKDNALNDIYTVFLSPQIDGKLGPQSAEYNHFNLLRTIEDNFGLGTMGDMDVVARPITGIWKKQ